MIFRNFAKMEGEPGAAGGGAAAAPESYTFAQVDGKDVDTGVAKEVSDFAKAGKLTQEQAQAAMNYRLGLKLAPTTPETYTFAQVDGKDVDAELVKDVSTFAKKHGLTQEQAQAFMTRELALTQQAGADNVAAVKAIQDTWRAEAKADSEIGGAKFDENLAISKKALEKFFPDIAKDANKHPFLDHPAVIKGLVRIGKAISSDGDLVSGSGNNAPVDPAKAFFPTMN